MLCAGRLYSERLESLTVDEQDVPWIFRSALHVAVWSNSVDVAKLLLHYGVDPNAGGQKPFTHEYYGSDTGSSPSPCTLSPNNLVCIFAVQRKRITIKPQTRVFFIPLIICLKIMNAIVNGFKY